MSKSTPPAIGQWSGLVRAELLELTDWPSCRLRATISLHRRNHGPVGFQEIVDEGADLVGIELGGRVWIEHRRLVNVLSFPGQGGRDRQFLDVDVCLHQRRQLRR